MRSGDPVFGFGCPQCGMPSVVYNGNYYCSEDGCWVMNPEDESPEDRKIIKAYLTQKRQEAHEVGDTQTFERMDGYLMRMETYEPLT